MTKTLHSKIYGLEMIAVVSIYLWQYWLWTFHDLDVKLYVVIYDADSVDLNLTMTINFWYAVGIPW